MMIVKGKSYRTNLQGTMQLRVMRKVKAEFGLGWGTVLTYMESVAEDDLLADLVSDAEFQAWMWAWILNAGDEMTRADLEALTAADIEFTQTEAGGPDAGEEPDAVPTSAPAGTGRGGKNQAAKAGKRPGPSTRTSKKPSSNASS